MLSGFGHMNISKYEVTTPETDRGLMLGCVVIGLMIAAIPPYGKRTVFLDC
jgi:hypothetical protein